MSRFEIWICGILSILEGLVVVLSFTIITDPCWTFKYLGYVTIKRMKKNIEEVK